MTKNWIKNNESNYTFSIDNKLIGTMEISYLSSERKAFCQIGSHNFSISRIGFWKSMIEINNDKGKLIAKVYPEKWYANSWIFEYNENKYKIVVRNNPLAEYAIIDKSIEQVAYGLTSENGKLKVKITTSSKISDFIFDYLLWYLFVPIATENMGDSFSFLMIQN